MACTEEGEASGRTGIIHFLNEYYYVPTYTQLCTPIHVKCTRGEVTTFLSLIVIGMICEGVVERSTATHTHVYSQRENSNRKEMLWLVNTRNFSAALLPLPVFIITAHGFKLVVTLFVI